jgi:hypothetical protein
MNKKILLVGGIGILVVAALFIAYRSYTKSFSPEAVAEFDQDSLAVRVHYCRPARKGRLIFGREQDNALVPYGRVWRTGANEATLITFSENVQIANTPIQAGTYSLWTIPGPARWQIILNEETGQWGTQYNDGMNVARVEVPIRVQPKTVEKFQIYFEAQANGADMILGWAHTEAIVPLRPN